MLCSVLMMRVSVCISGFLLLHLLVNVSSATAGKKGSAELKGRVSQWSHRCHTI